MVVIFQELGSELQLSQTVRTGILQIVLTSNLNFLQTLISNQQTVNLSSHFELFHTLRLQKSVSLSLSNKLTFEHKVFKGANLSLINYLQFAHGIFRGFILTSQLPITQTIVHSSPEILYHGLLMFQVLSYKFLRLRSLGSGLTIKQTLSFLHYRKGKLNTCDTYIDIPLAETTLVNDFFLGNDLLHLRRPEFGNSDALGHQLAVLETRGLDLIIFRDPQWPKSTTLNMTFKGIIDIEKDRILGFLRRNAGKSMFYTDHEERVWIGVIVNPEAELVQEQRCSYSINIIFLGELWNP